MIPDYIIIDFDSTFITEESLDELAKYKLSHQNNSQKKLNKIQSLTNAGMNGDIPFKQSLDQRMGLLNLNRADIKSVSKRLSECVTPSFNKNKPFFNEYNDTKELYDLKNDPNETTNLIGTGLSIEDALWKELSSLND